MDQQARSPRKRRKRAVREVRILEVATSEVRFKVDSLDTDATPELHSDVSFSFAVDPDDQRIGNAEFVFWIKTDADDLEIYVRSQAKVEIPYGTFDDLVPDARRTVVEALYERVRLFVAVVPDQMGLSPLFLPDLSEMVADDLEPGS
jgi:hypothetical protein